MTCRGTTGSPRESPHCQRATRHVGALTGANEQEQLFTALAGVMQELDLARISIPLDLVAKAWNRRG